MLSRERVPACLQYGGVQCDTRSVARVCFVRGNPLILIGLGCYAYYHPLLLRDHPEDYYVYH